MRSGELASPSAFQQNTTSKSVSRQDLCGSLMAEKPPLNWILSRFEAQDFAPDAIWALGPLAVQHSQNTTDKTPDTSAMKLRRRKGRWREVEETAQDSRGISASGEPEAILETWCAELSSGTTEKTERHRPLLLVDAKFLPMTRIGALVQDRIDALAVLDSENESVSAWQGTRTLFDHGFISCGAQSQGGVTVRCYLRSDLFRCANAAQGATRGVAAMSTLGRNGRFANQLFQYAFLRLYALRHELAVAVPAWQGSNLYRLQDQSSDGLKLPLVRFYAFDDDDLALWTADDPPIDVDFFGYFQELPPCWHPHRHFLRRLFSLNETQNAAVDRWINGLTKDGQPLVAIHVRRGDYVELHKQGLLWYRPIPLDWYVDWLTELRKLVPDFVLFVATDAPDDVLPAFAAFSPVSGADAPLDLTLAMDILDFEILRRAKHLAIANSSYSRMAALLAEDGQACVIPDFAISRFETYLPWSDRAFWQRFSLGQGGERGLGSSPEAIRHRSLLIRKELADATLASESLQQAQTGHERAISDYRQLDEQRQASIAALQGAVSRYQRLEEEQKASIAALQNTISEYQHLDEEQKASLAALQSTISEYQQLEEEQKASIAALQSALSEYQLLDEERKATIVALQGSLGDYRRLDHERRSYVIQLEAASADTKKRWLDDRGALLETRTLLAEALDDRRRAEADLQVALARAEHLERASARETDLQRALAAAQAEAAKATFLGSPRGLARRIAARPIIIVLRWLKALLAMFGAQRLAAKFASDEALLIERRYGEYLKLNRLRLTRWAPFGKASPSPPQPNVPPGASDKRPHPPANVFIPANEVLANDTHVAVQDRPSLLVVVPWLVQGGSEVVLLDVLSALSDYYAIAIVTVHGADHALRSAFVPIVDEIHHLGEIMFEEDIVGFIEALVQRRHCSVLLSSNSQILYRNIERFKRSAPHLRAIDILHNDLPEGHIRSAIAASPWIDRQVAVSRRVAASLVEGGVPPERIATIPNGVDADNIYNPANVDRAAARRKFAIAPDSFVIGFVGRFSDEKRPLAFLEIADAVADALDIHVLMVGEGPMAPAIHTALRAAPYPATLRPHLNREDMPHVYAAIDVVVLVSTIEGMPLVALEALAMGRPVAVTDVGDLSRIVKAGANGFIVPADEYRQLIGPIVALGRSSEQRARMEEAARESVMDGGLTKKQMLESYREEISKLENQAREEISSPSSRKTRG